MRAAAAARRDGGKRVSEITTVEATVPTILDLAAWLAGHGVWPGTGCGPARGVAGHGVWPGSRAKTPGSVTGPTG